MSDVLFGLLIALAILVILFLIFREILCWYWKINERIELHKELIHEIKKLNGNISTRAREDNKGEKFQEISSTEDEKELTWDDIQKLHRDTR
jgi:hypothetical protein